MTNRVKWIDVAKGIGAIYVIIGHFILNERISAMIYAFHMPLFFFLAGITFYLKEKESFLVFVKKKFSAIIIPYFLFSLPLFIFNCVLIVHNGENTVTLLLKRFIGIFLCWKTTDYYNGVWFLPCVFIAYLISYWIIRKSKNNIQILLFSIISIVLGILLDVINISLPLCIDTALISVFFICIAYVSNTIIGKTKWLCVVLYIPMIIIASINYNMSGKRIEMYTNDYGNYLFFIIASFCGIIATIGLANINLFTNNSLLNLLGKESMYMYGSQLIFLSMKRIILPKTGIYSLDSMIQIIIGLFISCFLIMILLKMKPLYYSILYKIKKYTQ